jgi:flagellar basal body P-ring protein FlgI
LEIPQTTSVADLVNTLNEIGVAPKDLTAIFQGLKAAGALEGELEIL